MLALTLGLAAPAMARDVAPAVTIDHSAQLDHHGGLVTARYRGALVVDHRQIGAAAPAGRPPACAATGPPSSRSSATPPPRPAPPRSAAL
ncbi:hypothetical protein MOP88_10980 [Sphingomonas sp. WKB10]|nr:hypothetical protein [Sphingomonas sp. WKB10]